MVAGRWHVLSGRTRSSLQQALERVGRLGLHRSPQPNYILTNILRRTPKFSPPGFEDHHPSERDPRGRLYIWLTRNAKGLNVVRPRASEAKAGLGA